MKFSYKRGKEVAEQWLENNGGLIAITREIHLIQDNNFGSHVTSAERNHWGGYIIRLQQEKRRIMRDMEHLDKTS